MLHMYISCLLQIKNISPSNILLISKISDSDESGKSVKFSDCCEFVIASVCSVHSGLNNTVLLILFDRCDRDND